MSLSGIIGLSLGDAFLFQSLVSVGTRLGSLLLSLAPIFGSIIAWIFFGETLTFWQITGIILALAGCLGPGPAEATRGEAAVEGGVGEGWRITDHKTGVDCFHPFAGGSSSWHASLKKPI